MSQRFNFAIASVTFNVSQFVVTKNTFFLRFLCYNKKNFKGPEMKKINTGFTLVEIMLVVMIIALLSSIFTINGMKARQHSQDAAAKANLKILASAAETYAATHSGSYPVALNQLEQNFSSIYHYCADLVGTPTIVGGHTYTCFCDPSGYTFTATHTPSGGSKDYEVTTSVIWTNP